MFWIFVRIASILTNIFKKNICSTRKTRIKQGLSYISFSSLIILSNSKVNLIATSLRTNGVTVTLVHCISIILRMFKSIADKVKWYWILLVDFSPFYPRETTYVISCLLSSIKPLLKMSLL